MQYKTLIIRDLVGLANKIDGVYKTLTNTDLVGLANIVATKDSLIKSIVVLALKGVYFSDNNSFIHELFWDVVYYLRGLLDLNIKICFSHIKIKV